MSDDGIDDTGPGMSYIWDEKADPVWYHYRRPGSLWNGSYSIENQTIPHSIRRLARIMGKEFNEVESDIYDLPQECSNIPLGGDYNWAHFNQCVVLPNATMELGLYEAQLPAGLIYDLAQYNITANMTRAAAKTTFAVPRALKAVCNTINCQRSGNSCVDATLYINPQTISEQGFQACQQDLCNRVRAMMTIDQDIGGIGVFSSYILQIAIGLVVALYIIGKWIQRWYRRYRGILSADAPISCSRAWMSFLIMFQKTQCWFVSALVIAAFIRGMRDDISDLDTSLLLLLSLNGVVLVSFTLLAVTYLGGPRSWFNFSISIVAYILCSAFLEVAVRRRIQRITSLWNGWQFCDGYLDSLPQSIDIDNFLAYVAYMPDAVFITCNVVCSIVMVILLIRQAGWSYSIVPRKARHFWRRHRKIMGGINVFFISIVFSATLGLGLYLLYLYFRIINKGDWGFGQIIAFTLWVPTIADFIQDRFWENDVNRAARRRRKSSTQVPINHIPSIVLETPAIFQLEMTEKKHRLSFEDEEYPPDKKPSTSTKFTSEECSEKSTSSSQDSKPAENHVRRRSTTEASDGKKTFSEV